ncbi:MAG: hypothetical protein RL477_999, partial [Pseudomonadota bacterium]
MFRFVRLLGAAALACACAVSGASAQSPEKVRMIGFSGASNLPIWLAIDKGLFAKHGLDVTLARTKGSIEQVKDMMAGKFDIATTAMDNVVAYTEGQGAAKLDIPFDMVAFMGVHSGMNTVVGVPSIKTFADIRGKAVAVDAPNTGYAFVLFKILDQNGLKFGKDYTLHAAGSGGARLAAMKEGKAVAAVMSAPNDTEAKAMGYTMLAPAASALGGYQGSVYAARKGWAKANEATMVKFIRAIVDAHDVIFTDAATAKGVLRKHLKKLTAAEVDTIYASLTSADGGLTRKAEINVAGVNTVLKLRSEFQQGARPLNDA